MKHDLETSEYMRRLGKRLAIARKLSGMSQSQVAERLRKNQTSYGSYERGDALPDVITLMRLSVIFDVNGAWLIGLPDGKGKGPFL